MPDDGTAKADPRPSVVRYRLARGPWSSPYLSRKDTMARFGLTEAQFLAVRAQLRRARFEARVGNSHAYLYGDRGSEVVPVESPIDVRGLYCEQAVARAIHWHGPLPSEVNWFRDAISRPETLEELQAIYRSDPDEWVYKCLKGSEVVYVGVTRTGINRIRQHIEHAEWMRLVTSIEVEHHENRVAAERREAQLITALRPRYNRSPGNVSLLRAS